jgi:hypothetical protein
MEDAMTTTETPTPAAPEDVISKEVLQARCALLEASVRNAGTVTAEQIAAVRPGGKENPDQSAHGHLFFFGALSRWFGMGPQQPTRHTMRWDAGAMEDLRRALHAEPIELTLESGERVACHPKGELAIKEVMINQVALRWITAVRLALEAMEPSPGVIDTLAKAVEAEHQLHGEFVAIVLHPGAGLPWDRRSRWDRPLPPIADTVTAFDLMAIRRAYWETNLFRVNTIADRTREFVKGGDAMPLEAYIGTLAGEMQLQPEVLVREWSRGETFAMSLTRFEANERAREKAESDAAARRGPRG